MNAISRYLPTLARILFGLIFFVFGLNGFLGFLPQPELPAEAGAFMGALAATGYFFPLLKGTEVLAGALLLGGRFVPLALVLLAPITVQIAAFHLALTPGQAGMGLFLVGVHAYLGYAWRASFAGLFEAKAAPATSDEMEAETRVGAVA